MPRWIALTGAVVAAVAVGWWLTPDSPGITRRNFDLIRTGASLSEVEQLMGSVGVEVTDEPPTVYKGGCEVPVVHGERIVVWWREDGTASVWVGFEQHRVVSAHYCKDRL